MDLDLLSTTVISRLYRSHYAGKNSTGKDAVFIL